VKGVDGGVIPSYIRSPRISDPIVYPLVYPIYIKMGSAVNFPLVFRVSKVLEQGGEEIQFVFVVEGLKLRGFLRVG
jgi:hypothetical protein